MIQWLDWRPSRKINYIYVDDISTIPDDKQTHNLEVTFLAQNDTKYVFNEINNKNYGYFTFNVRK